MIYRKTGESDGEPEPEDDNLDDDEFDVLSGEYVQVDGQTGSEEVLAFEQTNEPTGRNEPMVQVGETGKTEEVDSTIIQSIEHEPQGINDTQITQYEDPFSPLITPIKTESSIVHSISKNDFNRLMNQDIHQYTLQDLEAEYDEITLQIDEIKQHMDGLATQIATKSRAADNYIVFQDNVQALFEHYQLIYHGLLNDKIKINSEIQIQKKRE